MAELGTINLTYHERGKIVQKPLAYVVETADPKKPFSIELIISKGDKSIPLKSHYQQEIVKTIESSANDLTYQVKPIFFNETLSIVGKILVDKTHPTMPRAYRKRFKEDHDTLGIHFAGDDISPRFPYGVHIKIEEMDQFERTLYHEWGHECHNIACNKNKLPFDYFEYDEKMGEVAAILFERLVVDEEFGSEPHKTAYGLVSRSEWTPLLQDLPFHERWLEMMQYRKHQDLDWFLRSFEALKPL